MKIFKSFERRSIRSVIACLIIMASCTSGSQHPAWEGAFNYNSNEVYEIQVGAFGYPFVPVMIMGKTIMLPFDTGNMVGLSLSSENFETLNLNIENSYKRLNSAGEIIARLRVSTIVKSTIFGQIPDSTKIFELDHPSLPGIIGPSFLESRHFTIDYKSKKMGISQTDLPDSIEGFEKLPLVRSEHHPLLILVRGTIEGRSVVIELDTGKSRTVINPDLARELSLDETQNGVAISNLQIGHLDFELPNAKEVDQTGIDPSLDEPILAGIGSDILSQFVWTVDYKAGELWLPKT